MFQKYDKKKYFVQVNPIVHIKVERLKYNLA